MQYTAEDYNVTIKRGLVREDGMVLWGIRKYKGQRLLEWRTREAYDKAVKQKNNARQRRFVLHMEKIRKIKVSRGCECCGMQESDWPKKFKEGFPYFLHFDHIDPKTKTRDVSSMVTYSWRRLIAEIKKCRVLCFRCHAIHTGNQNRKDDAA